MKNIPKEVSRGLVNLGGLEIEVVVLDNGQRIITQESFEQLGEFLAPKELSTND